MKKLIYPLFILIILLSACTQKNGNVLNNYDPALDNSQSESDNLVVGFSQMNHINPWRVAETNDLKRKADDLGIKLIVLDGESSQEKQITDVISLIGRKVDYIVLAPLIYEGWDNALNACREAGIPLITLDREVAGIPGVDFLTFVGGDFVKEAKTAAEWLIENTGGSAKIIELRGREGASCVLDRERGFRETIEKYNNMEIVVSAYADFERIKGQRVMEEIILSYGRNFNVVYAHNDEMAIGAIQALKAANIQPGEDVLVISIDGSKDALKSVIAGELGATVECTPYLAEQVFAAIMRNELGKTVPHKIIVKERLFDVNNATEHIDEAF
ncbi:MAG: ABC transporter substrate-binding protein [Spirochaetales bacterium]|uniref:ABC transporter substrate-binding protein n=1 Tax=Candidatus Thalassospirochaeta sargassi TaxID=3119039 RepID=A0AAJ1MJP8_9SPIO|nr:ABC transporter substrate-binding protein [Spirochaetales bacterium]